MATNPAPTKKNKDLEGAALPMPGLEPASAGSGDPGTLTASLPLKARSDAAPLKPGVRTITLAQARAYHAAKHLGQA